MNGIVKQTWQSIHNLAFAFMNHAHVSEHFSDFALEHAQKVFNVLPLKDLTMPDGHPCTPYKCHFGCKPNIRCFASHFALVFIKFTHKNCQKPMDEQKGHWIPRTTHNGEYMEFM
jgi:hypothetical protein